jgi:hypothetical protein
MSLVTNLFLLFGKATIRYFIKQLHMKNREVERI